MVSEVGLMAILLTIYYFQSITNKPKFPWKVYVYQPILMANAFRIALWDFDRLGFTSLYFPTKLNLGPL